MNKLSNENQYGSNMYGRRENQMNEKINQINQLFYGIRSIESDHSAELRLPSLIYYAPLKNAPIFSFFPKGASILPTKTSNTCVLFFKFYSVA